MALAAVLRGIVACRPGMFKDIGRISSFEKLGSSASPAERLLPQAAAVFARGAAIILLNSTLTFTVPSAQPSRPIRGIPP